MQVLCMLFKIFVEHQDVVKEHQHKVPQLFSEYVIHPRLESGWCVRQSKGHDYKFVVALMRFESYFRNIFYFDSNLMITRFKIEFGENRGPM